MILKKKRIVIIIGPGCMFAILSGQQPDPSMPQHKL